MAKSVCVIGAGPSGIIAAKSLLYDHPHDTFKVTVFEQSGRIGGLWPVSPTDEGMIDPDMTTNLSRHTVSFSDLAWPESSPTFPRAWQVGQYLSRYLEKYPGVDIRTSCKVTKTSRNVAPGSRRWKVEVEKRPADLSNRHTPQANECSLESSKHQNQEWRGSSQQTLCETFHFDHLIVASGFFGKPNISEPVPNPEGYRTPVLHSSQIRNFSDLYQGWGTSIRNRGDKILVVGGSMSGAETAASIAKQLSSAKHSAETSINDAENYKVHHLTRHPFWAMPSFLPVEPILDSINDQTKFNPAPYFLPLDLVMYNLSKRPGGEITNRSGHITPEAATNINAFLQSFVGTDQSDLRHDSQGDLAIQGKVCECPPRIALSDSYAEFVRSGQIIVHKGDMSSWGALDADEGTHVLLSPGEKGDSKEVFIEGVAAIILATGFDPVNSLHFLPVDVLESLEYDPINKYLPLTLNVHSTAHPSIPDLGFVGFYRGPFWGVMEMQARFLGKLWTGGEKAAEALDSFSEDAQIIKHLYKQNPTQLSPFPMGDYVYLMESFKGILGIEVEGESGKGPVVPARYALRGVNSESKEESMKAVALVGGDTQKSAKEARFVARAIFRSLQGDWRLNRVLKSSIASYPSGVYNGTAKFFPRYPDKNYDSEYLYLEEGDFETESGLKFAANRRYAHRYQEATDTLSVWFIKPDNKTVDYLFHELEILPREETSAEPSGWRAKAHHLCIADTYNVKYEFRFRGANIDTWTLAYSVKGPSKDYRIESVYRR